MKDRSGFVVLEALGDAAHPDLSHWHGNIGQPVALDLGTPLAGDTTALDVLSWNVAIGLGRLEEVVEKIRGGVFDGEKRSSARPLIIMAQEAYREDPTVPAEPLTAHHGGKVPKGERIDIVEAATALGFSLRYAPSMRNGGHASDRGNAILSSASIKSASAFALPYVRQRRVAVAAELDGFPWMTFVSAHLDTHGRVRSPNASRAYASGRSAQALALAKRLADDWGTEQTVLLGADLNSYLATREPMMRAFKSLGFQRIPHTPRRSHTFHSPPIRMLLDHIMVRTPAAAVTSISVKRLDENVNDRGRYIFGSDHHPMLCRLEISGPERRSVPRPPTSDPPAF